MRGNMLNPLALPNEVMAALRSVTAIERLLEVRIGRLPADIEQTLRHHFEGQRADLAQLHDELVANREQAEQLPGKVDGLREEIGAVRAVLSEVLGEIAEVRETLEPLQGPAERAARLSERLPGGG